MNCRMLSFQEFTRIHLEFRIHILRLVPGVRLGHKRNRKESRENCSFSSLQRLPSDIVLTSDALIRRNNLSSGTFGLFHYLSRHHHVATRVKSKFHRFSCKFRHRTASRAGMSRSNNVDFFSWQRLLSRALRNSYYMNSI